MKQAAPCYGTQTTTTEWNTRRQAEVKQNGIEWKDEAPAFAVLT
jgi:hypothetical protein